jgi:hypothetical protein
MRLTIHDFLSYLAASMAAMCIGVAPTLFHITMLADESDPLSPSDYRPDEP